MVDIINVNDKRWTRFIERHHDSAIFHHPAWSRLLEECYGYKPFAVVQNNERGEIDCGLPVIEINSWLTGKRWVSLPFSDHCRVLSKTDEALTMFSKQLKIEVDKRKDIKHEIRYEVPSLNLGKKGKSYYSHFLKMDANPENVFKEFRKKGVRYCIKKALKSGIVIKHSTDDDSMMQYFDLHLLTRKKLGVPTQPKRYFRMLQRHLVARDLAFISIAYYEGAPIAGGVFLKYNQKIVYKYGATDPEYLNLYANHALLWDVIKWGCLNDFLVFDWGRTDKDNQGLRQFKLGWGSIEEDLTYSQIGDYSTNYSTGWKQGILKKIVSNSPSWVGRILGELLYKHVG